MILNNYTSLETFEKSLKEILDVYYIYKNVVPETSHRRNWIRADIETVFKSLHDAGITATWKHKRD